MLTAVILPLLINFLSIYTYSLKNQVATFQLKKIADTFCIDITSANNNSSITKCFQKFCSKFYTIPKNLDPTYQVILQICENNIWYCRCDRDNILNSTNLFSKHQLRLIIFQLFLRPMNENTRVVRHSIVYYLEKIVKVTRYSWENNSIDKIDL